jgi:hypothetical protein
VGRRSVAIVHSPIELWRRASISDADTTNGGNFALLQFRVAHRSFLPLSDLRAQTRKAACPSSPKGKEIIRELMALAKALHLRSSIGEPKRNRLPPCALTLQEGKF